MKEATKARLLNQRRTEEQELAEAEARQLREEAERPSRSLAEGRRWAEEAASLAELRSLAEARSLRQKRDQLHQQALPASDQERSRATDRIARLSWTIQVRECALHRTCREAGLDFELFSQAALEVYDEFVELKES